MANKPKSRRSRGRYIRGNVDEQLNLGTLNGGVVVTQIFDNTVNERSLLSSIVATWALSDWTKIADVGPITVGVCHSDYTDSEVQEWIDNQGSWNEGDKVQQEVAKRLCRIIGTFEAPASAEEIAILNDGKPIKTKLNWILLQGQTLDLFAFNAGTGNVATTTPDVDVQGHVNLWAK